MRLRIPDIQSLENQLPGGTAPAIHKWILELKVEFIISKPRKTKLGDFRPAYGKKPARITVNGDLNRYHFLITTLHEFAHLGCYLKHGNKVLPHGKEWKAIYSQLLKKFLKEEVFPEKLVPAVKKHLTRPSASSCTDPELLRTLALFDHTPKLFLSQVPLNSHFSLHDRSYKVLEKRRTRYLCLRLDDRKKYLVSGNAVIEQVEA